MGYYHQYNKSPQIFVIEFISLAKNCVLSLFSNKKKLKFIYLYHSLATNFQQIVPNRLQMRKIFRPKFYNDVIRLFYLINYRLILFAFYPKVCLFKMSKRNPRSQKDHFVYWMRSFVIQQLFSLHSLATPKLFSFFFIVFYFRQIIYIF